MEEPKTLAKADDSVLLRIPSELLAAICVFLPNKDIKALRLAGPAICHAVPPRFSRVFLSPNSHNVAVFRAIVSHPTFRLSVREIIYDDARLADPNVDRDRLNDATRTDAHEELSELDAWMGAGLQSAAKEGAKRAWFGSRRERNLRELHGRNANDTGNLERKKETAKQRAAQLPLETCYQHYLGLVREQAKMMEAGEDIKALVEGIEAFPALERITITPATHGYLYTPLYYTPMIRSLPYGFNGPIPRGWPTSKDTPQQLLLPWVTGPRLSETDVKRQKERWRGLVLVIKTLAERIRNGHSVVAGLVMDVHSLNTGVSPYMLTQECEEYDNLKLILQQPEFHRLDLPILITGVRHNDVAILEDGRLKSLLASAQHLQHFRLRGDGQIDPDSPSPRRFFPLQTLVPVNAWPQLRHFGLSKFVVRIDDLVAALARLPLTLRSVELSFLDFHGSERRENHESLLRQMKLTLPWATWPVDARPQVTMGMAKVTNNVDGRGLWFSKEIGEYLYGDKRNPFGWHRDVLLPGVGWLKDEYDEDFTRPYLGYKDYRALWYSEIG